MIKVSNLQKSFCTADMRSAFVAIKGLSCEIPSGCIYGLVGANGSGKSTFLRVIAGVYAANGGSVEIDGENVFDNPRAKEKLVFVPDELYFPVGYSLSDMAKMYSLIYKRFSLERFKELCSLFRLDGKLKQSLSGFSKGMRRQAATVLALSAMTEYVLFDETFDGLDPMVRNLVKQVMYRDVLDRGTAFIVTSHSLRELEDTCDRLALLYDGELVLSSEADSLKTSFFKVQTAFSEPYGKEKFKDIDMQAYEQEGNVCRFIVKGDRQEIERYVCDMEPILFNILPLSFDEIFVCEMKTRGYVFDDIL